MQTITVEYGGKTYESFAENELLAAGVPPEAIASGKAIARRELIKAECRRRIYGIASAEAQLNISGAATVISSKLATDRLSDETEFLETYAASLGWIMDMRAAVETLDDLQSADFLSDDAWPECPGDVVALASQY
jgi:hypothetical protein